MKSSFFALALGLALAVGACRGLQGADLTISSFDTWTGETDVVIQATGVVTFRAGLPPLPPLPAGTAAGSLTVMAGRDIILQTGATLAAGPGWTISLIAGADPAAPGTAVPGLGDIILAGSAGVRAMDGSVSCLAGRGVTVGTGFITTVAGGDIRIEALAGTVNAGTRPNGFLFSSSTTNPYLVDPGLGGISTAAGGSVSLTAGLDVISLLPALGSSLSTGGSGAFGEQPGNVTIKAGRDVQGHYIVRRGVGTIQAARDAGTVARMLALSVVAGGWTVDAGHDVVLQEARNPNGVFNNIGPSLAPWHHRFDYSPDAYVVLRGSHSVQLTGASVPRLGGALEQGIPQIYPGRLEITAGDGGVTLGGDVILFPSGQGRLAITTSSGGSLVGGRSGGVVALIASDSARIRYEAPEDFGLTDHASVPVHSQGDGAVSLQISGDLTGILLGAPTRAVVEVGGSMMNSRLCGQNVHDSDTTTLRVSRDILNQAGYADGTGYLLGGGGNLSITAHHLDLGTTTGIVSQGARANAALGSLAARGADLVLALSGNLDMAHSQIATLKGGGIRIDAGGMVNIGSRTELVDARVNRGVFSTQTGDVSIHAADDIQVNGSRIAAYDGGNLLVDSEHGSVDVGPGGGGFVDVERFVVDPVTGEVRIAQITIPGGGILATTLPPWPDPGFPTERGEVGNISISAARDVIVGCGAIAQIPLNGTSGAGAVLTVRAGGDVFIPSDCPGLIATGTLHLQAGNVLPFLRVELESTSLVAAAGSSISIRPTIHGVPPFAFQWFKDGTAIPGATEATLSLQSLTRAEAGTYVIAVSNVFASTTKQVSLRVLANPRLDIASSETDGFLLLSLASLDGPPLNPSDLAAFEVQTSANLIDWVPVNQPLGTNLEGTFSCRIRRDPGAGMGFFRFVAR